MKPVFCVYFALMNVFLFSRIGNPLPNHPPQNHEQTAEENEQGGDDNNEVQTDK